MTYKQVHIMSAVNISSAISFKLATLNWLEFLGGSLLGYPLVIASPSYVSLNLATVESQNVKFVQIFRCFIKLESNP